MSSDVLKYNIKSTAGVVAVLTNKREKIRAPSGTLLHYSISAENLDEEGGDKDRAAQTLHKTPSQTKTMQCYVSSKATNHSVGACIQMGGPRISRAIAWRNLRKGMSDRKKESRKH